MVSTDREAGTAEEVFVGIKEVADVGIDDDCDVLNVIPAVVSEDDGARLDVEGVLVTAGGTAGAVTMLVLERVMVGLATVEGKVQEDSMLPVDRVLTAESRFTVVDESIVAVIVECVITFAFGMPEQIPYTEAYPDNCELGQSDATQRRALSPSVYPDVVLLVHRQPRSCCA